EQTYGGRLPTPYIQAWNSLPSLQLPLPGSSNYSFDYLIKGFIPCDLPILLRTLFSKVIANDLLLVTMGHINLMFFKDVWSFRNREFTLIERSLDITNTIKKQGSRGSNVSRSASSHITSSQSVPPKSSLSRWHKWIARAIGSGTSWLGFPLYINSLIR